MDSGANPTLHSQNPSIRWLNFELTRRNTIFIPLSPSTAAAHLASFIFAARPPVNSNLEPPPPPFAMAKSSRASTVKANNRRLKRNVFGPVEAARLERLSAKLLETAAQPKPVTDDAEEMKIVDGQDEEAVAAAPAEDGAAAETTTEDGE